VIIDLDKMLGAGYGLGCTMKFYPHYFTLGKNGDSEESLIFTITAKRAEVSVKQKQYPFRG
jgi:hypothetical protein